MFAVQATSRRQEMLQTVALRLPCNCPRHLSESDVRAKAQAERLTLVPRRGQDGWQGVSKMKGSRFHPYAAVAGGGKRGKDCYLGSFPSAIEAALAYARRLGPEKSAAAAALADARGSEVAVSASCAGCIAAVHGAQARREAAQANVLEAGKRYGAEDDPFIILRRENREGAFLRYKGVSRVRESSGGLERMRYRASVPAQLLGSSKQRYVGMFESVVDAAVAVLDVLGVQVHPEARQREMDARAVGAAEVTSVVALQELAMGEAVAASKGHAGGPSDERPCGYE